MRNVKGLDMSILSLRCQSFGGTIMHEAQRISGIVTYDLMSAIVQAGRVLREKGYGRRRSSSGSKVEIGKTIVEDSCRSWRRKKPGVA